METVDGEAGAAAQYWNQRTAQSCRGGARRLWWEAGPEIDAYNNIRVTGRADVNWLPYTLDKYFFGRLPLERSASLGCGVGHFERQLAGLGVFQACDAYDVAATSIRVANDLARQEGVSQINYQVADINRITLQPAAYDCVWVIAAMHHFSALEHICQQIRQALRPDGFLVLNEYVGPNRFQFPPRQKELTNLCLMLLPEAYRTLRREAVAVGLEGQPTVRNIRWMAARLLDMARDGNLVPALRYRLQKYYARFSGKPAVKKSIHFPTVRDVVAVDPSEAIRSEEIVPVLQEYFEIVELKERGGNILHFLLADLAGNFLNDDDPQARALLRMIIAIEDTLLQCGELQSDFAYIVARPKP